MLCAFPHRQGCVKIENSALANVSLILLFVCNIHAAIMERKHLRVEKCDCEYLVRRLKNDVAATNCSAQRTSI